MSNGRMVSLEAVLKRDRAVVIATLTVVILLAWAYLAWLAAAMDHRGVDHAGMDHGNMDHTMPAAPGTEAPTGGHAGMDMTGTMDKTMDKTMDMGGMDMGTPKAPLAPALAPWRPGEAALMATMWFVMMVGMMLPSAAPMLLLYARVGRQAEASGKPFAATGWFAGGYLAAWALFSLLATTAQWTLQSLALLTPMAALASRSMGGLVLIAAGLYQFTPLKGACLSKCRSPLAFIQSHGGFRRDPGGAFALGLRHGLYCIGCCVALMVLLFVGGVMNLLWVAGLAILVLGEKVLPFGTLLARVAGAALIAAGAWLLAT
ncbi:DUF2182 domain-containing protein [Chelatococcus daeguensis]|nr:DUF2182 domain-containing protein [Chelatococcus daeguensis]